MLLGFIDVNIHCTQWKSGVTAPIRPVANTTVVRVYRVFTNFVIRAGWVFIFSKAHSLGKKFLGIVQVLYCYNNREELLADSLNNL